MKCYRRRESMCEWWHCCDQLMLQLRRDRTDAVSRSHQTSVPHTHSRAAVLVLLHRHSALRLLGSEPDETPAV